MIKTKYFISCVTLFSIISLSSLVCTDSALTEIERVKTEVYYRQVASDLQLCNVTQSEIEKVFQFQNILAHHPRLASYSYSDAFAALYNILLKNHTECTNFMCIVRELYQRNARYMEFLEQEHENELLKKAEKAIETERINAAKERIAYFWQESQNYGPWVDEKSGDAMLDFTDTDQQDSLGGVYSWQDLFQKP